MNLMIVFFDPYIVVGICTSLKISGYFRPTMGMHLNKTLTSGLPNTDNWRREDAFWLHLVNLFNEV